MDAQETHSSTEEGSSTQSESISDEQESSVQKDSEQQSSDDAADTQADTSSQKDSQHPKRGHLAQDSRLLLGKKRNSQKSSKRSQRARKFFGKLKVKVFLVVTGKTFGAHEVLLEQVKKSKQLKVKTTTDIQGCDVIIVFCPIKSRLHSDVEAAMRNITADKPVILVAMHHTRNPEHSTGGMAVSEKFPNVVLDVHVLFHETENGLLTCPRNDQAVSQMKKKLKKLSKHSGSSR